MSRAIADIYVADLQYFKTAFKKADVMGARSSLTCRQETDAIHRDNRRSLRGQPWHRGATGGCTQAEIGLDVLVMYNDGSMKTFSPGDFDVDGTLSSGVYQIWSFGPMLLKTGGR